MVKKVTTRKRAPIRARQTANKRKAKSAPKYEGELCKTLLHEFEMCLPTHLNLNRGRGKETRISLNLNWYRNASYYHQNASKKLFCGLLEEQLKPIRLSNYLTIHYYYIIGSRRVCDVPNTCTIVDKYFQDSLSYYHCIEDDNFRIVPETRYKFGGYQKGNSHVRVHIQTSTEDNWNIWQAEK